MHMRFRLAPWSMTLDDLEGLNGYKLELFLNFALSNFKRICPVAALSHVTVASARLLFCSSHPSIYAMQLSTNYTLALTSLICHHSIPLT